MFQVTMQWQPTKSWLAPQRLDIAQIRRDRLQANRVDFTREIISVSYAKSSGATATLPRFKATVPGGTNMRSEFHEIHSHEIHPTMSTTSTVGTSGGGAQRTHFTESTWKLDTSEHRSMRKMDHRGSFKPLRKALGIIGTLSIVAGTLVILAVLAVLVFLWTGEGPNEGQGAAAFWRMIVLDQWLTQSITLLAVVLRFTNAVQASVCTGLIAALILERHGVPLKHLAEFSMIRSINDGPFRLTWLLSTHPRRSPLAMTLLVLVLMLGSLTVQFTSTILVSDLGTSTIVGDARNESRGIAATRSTLNQFHLVNQYVLKPSFVPFGEVSGTDPTPNERGVSDTGVVRRVQPFVPRENRTTLRQYRGLSLVLNSRMVCLPPVIDKFGLDIIPISNPSFGATYTYTPFLSGSISYIESFRNAGVEFPPDCANGACFPTEYNCSIPVPVMKDGRPGIAGCIPNGRNAVVSSEKPPNHLTIRPEPIANTSEVFLFTKSSNVDRLAQLKNRNISSYLVSSSKDEWTTYSFGQGANLSLSLCFQQLHYDRSNVELQTTHDLKDGEVNYIADKVEWDTSNITKTFGSPDYERTKTTTQRGIYSIKELRNSTLSSMTRYLSLALISDSYSSATVPNVSISLSPYSGGDFQVFPHVEYQALFADVLEATNRPGVALQNLITALSGSIIDSLLSQLDYMDDVETVSSVSVPAPRRRTGLIAVLLIHAVNVVAVVVIVSLYLVGTECSSQGNYWHAIAQIVSDITEPVLHRSAQATDDEVAFALQDYDAHVKIARSQPSGRVQLVRCEEPYV